jgi:hypothetical protein
VNIGNMLKPALSRLHAALSSDLEVNYVPPAVTSRSRGGAVLSSKTVTKKCVDVTINWSPTPEQITPFGDVPENRTKALVNIWQCPVEILRQGSLEIEGKRFNILAVTRSPLDFRYHVLIGVE